MARPDLMFMTQENQAQMLAEMARRQAVCSHDWEEIRTPAIGKHPEVVRTVCKGCLVEKHVFEAAQKSRPRGVSVARGSFTTPPAET